MEERQVGTRSRSELESTAQTVTEQNQRSERESGDSLTESGEHALSPAISTVGRQGSIVRASGLTVSDRDAAVRARREPVTASLMLLGIQLEEILMNLQMKVLYVYWHYSLSSLTQPLYMCCDALTYSVCT